MEILLFVTIWFEIEGIALSEKNQGQINMVWSNFYVDSKTQVSKQKVKIKTQTHLKTEGMYICPSSNVN